MAVSLICEGQLLRSYGIRLSNEGLRSEIPFGFVHHVENIWKVLKIFYGEFRCPQLLAFLDQ